MQTTPYIYMGRKLYLRKPRNLSPRLLGLAYRAPTRRLRVAYGALLPYFLIFLGTTTAVISLRTRQYRKLLLYYYRVIRGRLLLALLPSISISFIIQNQFSIFQLISYQVTALRPFYIKSSILQFSMPATKSITSQFVRKGHNSITCFGVCLGHLYLYLGLYYI